ncbi:MAG: hypothetical protein R2771_15405 [Saprospiraceae bacterium]
MTNKYLIFNAFLRASIAIGFSIILLLSCREDPKSTNEFSKQYNATESNYSTNDEDIQNEQEVSSDCNNVPHMFPNFKYAQNYIRSLDWNLIDNVKFDGNSWILGAEYYSCDEITGYFIIKAAHKSYIHDSLEVELWNRFKKTSEPGRYYNNYLRGKYQMYDRIE